MQSEQLFCCIARLSGLTSSRWQQTTLETHVQVIYLRQRLQNTTMMKTELMKKKNTHTQKKNPNVLSVSSMCLLEKIRGDELTSVRITFYQIYTEAYASTSATNIVTGCLDEV